MSEMAGSIRFPFLHQISGKVTKTATCSPNETIDVYIPSSPGTGYTTYLEDIYKGSLPQDVPVHFNSDFDSKDNLTSKHGVSIITKMEESPSSSVPLVGATEFMHSKVTPETSGKYFVVYRATRVWISKDPGVMMIAEITVN